MRTLILMGAAALGVAGCATYPATPQGSAYGLTTAKKAPFGDYLVAPDGRSLYILEGTRGTAGARCSGECLRAWPPLHVEGPPGGGGGIDQARLSTVRAHDGDHVTYDGWPLYYYHRDGAPGDTTGQHVADRWGTWHLLAPSGEPIRPRPY